MSSDDVYKQQKPTPDPSFFENLERVGQQLANKHDDVAKIQAQNKMQFTPPVAGVQRNEILESVLNSIGQFYHHEPVVLPSRGKFYDGNNGPTDGVVHLRCMTGKEEEILSSPRNPMHGKDYPIRTIIRNCMQEAYDPDTFLSEDQYFILIYLRGVSYTEEYNVEVRCPHCAENFAQTINLNTDLQKNECPDDFSAEDLHGELPVTKFKFKYRYCTPGDEHKLTEARERKIKNFGAGSVDDTYFTKIAMLISDLQGLTTTADIKTAISRLPSADVNHLRNTLFEPPFGVDSTIDMGCPYCGMEFKTGLPLGADFFSPKVKKDSKTSA